MPNGLKTVLLLGLLSGVLLVIGQVLGGSNGMLIGFIFAVVMNFGSYWFSDKIVLRMYTAKEVGAGHRLYAIVERLSRQAQLPMPKVYIIPDPSPNAFATGRNPSHAAVEAAFRGLHPMRAGTRLTIKGGFERPPMERTAAVAGLFTRASEVASSLGRDLREGPAGGGSDGNFTAALGVPTLDGLGAVGDGAHAAHEHVDMTALPWRAALLAGLLCSFHLQVEEQVK